MELQEIIKSHLQKKIDISLILSYNECSKDDEIIGKISIGFFDDIPARAVWDNGTSKW